MNILKGSLRVPSDKSISHRAILFSALASGQSIVRLFEPGRDNMASLRAVSELGVLVSVSGPAETVALAKEEKIQNAFVVEDAEYSIVELNSPGFKGLTKPLSAIDCGNSGTTARLLCGILAGLPFETELWGDSSLSARPFARVKEPLELMGAKFSADKLPLKITGGGLKGIDYQSPRASAQVKTAVLLAGLSATGRTSVTEPCRSRDHSEHLISAMGGELFGSFQEESWKVELSGDSVSKLNPIKDFISPGDFSSASFLMVAATLLPGSSIKILECGVNPSRVGLLKILLRMGAEVKQVNPRVYLGEPVADLLVNSSNLRGVEISGQEVVEAIDEIPILAIAAAFADGLTEISGAEELRVKETDRLKAMAGILELAGVEVREKPDGLIIKGNPSLREKSVPSLFEVDSWKGSHDHRIEMSAAIMDLVLGHSLKLAEEEVVETSFPRFIEYCQSVMSGD